MEIDDSPLAFEIERVIDSDQIPPVFDYTGQFKMGNEYLPAMRVVGIESKNHYQTDVGPDLKVQVLVGFGDMSLVLYPNRANLEFMLIREIINPNGNIPMPGEDTIHIETFNAKLGDEVRAYSAENNEAQALDRATLNLTDLVVVTVSLKPKAVDYFAKMDVGGNFRNALLGPATRDLIQFHTDQADLGEDDKLLGISIDLENANKTAQAMVSIEHGTKLIDLPDYIHKKVGGLYPTGLASFIQDRVWYIFPPYAPVNFDSATEKLVLIFAPSKRYPTLEKTYVFENNVGTIIITGDKKIQSPKEDLQQVVGNGTYFADAGKVMGDFTTSRGGISLMSRNEQLSNFVTEQRADRQNVMRMAPEKLTANPFVVMSRLAMSQGHIVMVNWHNADPRVLKPGMSIRSLFMNDGEYSSLDGILIGLELNVLLKGSHAIANGYETIASLLVFVKSDSTSNDLLGLS